MVQTTKDASLQNLQAIASLIVQSPESQIQQIVDAIGVEVTHLSLIHI